MVYAIMESYSSSYIHICMHASVCVVLNSVSSFPISSNYPVVIATASVSNLYLMRRNELKEGIEVKDSRDQVVGTSFIAARRVSIL